MYATAHRVWSRRTGRTGINAFLHRHDTDDARVDWNAGEVLEIVTTTNPGRAINELIEVAPGGNEVRSHLDVVAPDSTTLEQVRAVLVEAETVLPESTARTLVRGDVRVAFGCQPGLRGAEALELAELAAAVRRVLSEPPRPRTEGEPVRVLVTEEEGALVYRLAPQDVERVRTLGGHPMERVSLRTAHDIAQDFERLYGDIGPELARVVTGLTPEQLIAAGGVEFINVQSGTVLRRWPRPRA